MVFVLCLFTPNHRANSLTHTFFLFLLFSLPNGSIKKKLENSFKFFLHKKLTEFFLVVFFSFSPSLSLFILFQSKTNLFGVKNETNKKTKQKKKKSCV